MVCCSTNSYFYPRPPRGGRLQCERPGIAGKKFLSTPSARRATNCTTPQRAICAISIHALREEGDSFHRPACYPHSNFYPRPPRGGRRKCCRTSGRGGRISIHALREEGDAHLPVDVDRHAISIHALREEVDLPFGAVHCTQKSFLSTPSARRATAKTETKSLFSNKLYNILHEFRRALIYNGSKSYPNHAK